MLSGAPLEQHVREQAEIPTYTELLEPLIAGLDEHVPAESVSRLAELWSMQLSKVIYRVMELTRESGRVAWHRQARAESVGELARLTLTLAQNIVKHQTRERSLRDIDVNAEEAALLEPHALERIENTAQIVAEHIWFKVYDCLQQAYPLVRSANEREWPPTLPGSRLRKTDPRTKRNHYVPRFSIEPWRDFKGELRVLRRRPNGTVLSRNRPSKSWGFEPMLYGQHYEDWFGQIESSASKPYAMLRSCTPLSPDDRYFWIAFMILQYVRTPSFMATLARGLRRKAVAEGWPWAMTPELLRRAYLTLFDDDRLFTSYYRRFDRRRWRILVAAPGHAFPRTDCPVVSARVGQSGGWCCYFPLSPTQCFKAGPDAAGDREVPAALSVSLSPEESETVNAALLRASRRSFGVRTTDPTDHWQSLAERCLPLKDPVGSYRAWGPIDNVSADPA